MKNSDIKKYFNKKAFFYLEDVVKKFGHQHIGMEMQPMVEYLLNSTYLMIAGHLEKKLELCKYYLAVLDYKCREQLNKKNFGSPYDANTVVKIIKNIYNYNKNNCQINLHSVYKDNIDNVNVKIASLFKKEENGEKNIEFLEYIKNEYFIFTKNVILIKDKEEKYFYDIYNNAYKYRYVIAHNLNSICTKEFSDISEDVIESNYFIRIGMFFCVDEVLNNEMNKILDGNY